MVVVNFENVGKKHGLIKENNVETIEYFISL